MATSETNCVNHQCLDYMKLKFPMEPREKPTRLWAVVATGWKYCDRLGPQDSFIHVP